MFLYPVREYIEVAQKLNWRSLEVEPNLKHLNAIIDTRYREQGFLISWLLFRQKGSDQPDLAQLSPAIKTQPHDLFLSAGITISQMKGKIYPDLNFIYSQLPQNLDQIVIAGFHHWDCVDKTAEFFYKKGVPAKVDEDLTDHFFWNPQVFDIPLLREGSKTKKPEMAERSLKQYKKARNNKPWFNQI